MESTGRKAVSRYAGAAWVALVVGVALLAYHGSVDAPWLFDDHVVAESVEVSGESFCLPPSSPSGRPRW